MSNYGNPALVSKIAGSVDSLARPYSLADSETGFIRPLYLYDTRTLTDTTETDLWFFRLLEGQGVDIFDTNNSRQNMVSPSQAIVVNNIKFAIQTNLAKPFTEATFYSGLVYPLQKSILKIVVNDSEFCQIPLWNLITLQPPISNNTDSAFALQGLNLESPLRLRPDVNWEMKIELWENGISRPDEFSEVRLQMQLSGLVVSPITNPAAG